MKHISKLTRMTALLLCLIMALALSACGQEAESSQTQTFAMNTIITLTAYGKNREAGLDAAKSVIFSMDAMLDPQIETSVVAAMNRANGASTVVPGQVARMIEVAKEIYKRSDGALDPTIYPLVQLWGFVDQKYYVPSDEEISQAKGRLCFNDVTLTSFPATGTYTVTMPDYARMTFGAIGKGCAAQYVIDAMRNAGAKVDALDCLALAEKAGSSKAVNIVLMGRLSHCFDLPEAAWDAALEAVVPPKFLELNRRAFALGRDA